MKSIRVILNQDICPVLPSHIANLIMSLSDNTLNKVTEIRIRSNQPLLLILDNRDIMVTISNPTSGKSENYYCSSEDLARTFQLICKNSVYAFEEEVRQGYLTINGGHRVGLAGQATVFDGTINTLKNISSLNIRIAKAIPGCADKVLPFIIDTRNQRVFNTLLISPPRCGKTTILRDLIRQLSIGNPNLGITGAQIGIVDERSEIAACKNGIPSIDLGPRVDVLDACPKASGMLMLIRSMAPDIVATDELGRLEDVTAIREALQAGVSVLATAHSQTLQDLNERPYVNELVKQNFFQRYVILSKRFGPGTVEEIFDSCQSKALYTCQNEVKVCG